MTARNSAIIKTKQEADIAYLNGICDGWVAEHRFHDKRRWRFDYANPSHMLAVEVDGGAWVAGRHTRGAGFLADQEKRNTATAMGWRVFNVTPKTFVTVGPFIRALL